MQSMEQEENKLESNAEDMTNYTDQLKEFRYFNKEAKFVEKEISRYVRDVGPLYDARICLSVGTGYGEFDIMFIKKCLPNLEKFIVVEKDGSCIEQLKINLKKEFGEKFQVVIHKMKLEDFMQQKFIDLERQVDVVLSFHAMYYLTSTDQTKFFKSCADIWLKLDSGVLVILNSVGDCDLGILYERTRGSKSCCIYKVEKQMKSLGFELTYSMQHQLNFDFSDTHKAYNCLLMISSYATEEVFTEILKEVSKDCNVKQTCRFCVFKRGFS